MANDAILCESAVARTNLNRMPAKQHSARIMMTAKVRTVYVSISIY